MQQPRIRPAGIVVLVVLEVIGSVIALIGGIGVIVLSTFIGSFIGQMPEELPGELPSEIPLTSIASLASGIIIILGAILIILALIGLLVAWGLWTGRGWAWTVAFIFAILGIIVGLVNLVGSAFGLIPIVINGAIAYYLWRPHVKAYFGKGAPPLTGRIYCPNCGAENEMDARFCRSCGAQLIR